MKKLLGMILALSVLLTLGGAEAKRIAVAEPMAQNGITAQEIGGISNYLEAKLGGGYEVYSRASLRQILKEFEFTQSGMVLDDEGRAALEQKSVDALLAYSIARIGERLSMTIMVVDVKSGRISPEHRVALEARTLDQLFAKIDAALQKVGLLRTTGAKQRKTLAVFPTVGSGGATATQTEQYGNQLAEYLLKTGVFELLSREELKKIETESALLESALADSGQAAKIGQLQIADYLIAPKITRFENRTESVGSAIAGYAGTRQIMRVQIAIRIVEVATGKILAVENVTCALESRDIPAAERRNWNAADYDNALLTRAAAQSGEALLARLEPILVASVDGDELILTRGEGGGIRPGQKYRVFNLGKKIVHPRTGKVLGAREVPVAEVVITSVIPDMSYARIISKSAEVRDGAVCRPLEEGNGSPGAQVVEPPNIPSSKE